MKSILAILALAAISLAANPYVDLTSDEPVSATYAGKEWGDNVETTSEDGIDFSSKVTLQRLATMSWGQVVKVSFAPKGKRKIEPAFLLVTDGQILRLISENMDREIKVISEMKKQPKFEKGDVLALTTGALKISDESWTTEVKIKEDVSTYLTDNGNGSYTKWVFKKGEGLVEYSEGQGVADGFRLKAPKK